MFTLATLGTGTLRTASRSWYRTRRAIAEIADALQSDTLGEYLSTRIWSRSTAPSRLPMGSAACGRLS